MIAFNLFRRIHFQASVHNARVALVVVVVVVENRFSQYFDAINREYFPFDCLSESDPVSYCHVCITDAILIACTYAEYFT